MKTASKMTYTVSSGALNFTPTKALAFTTKASFVYIILIKVGYEVVLVDFKKAVDSVNHNIILNKLYEKNIPHCLIK